MNFAATAKRLTDAIEAAGMTMFARIDHADAARQAGLAMPPTMVFIYGNAKAGTPVMVEAPKAALDLPLRVLVREDDTTTYISFHPIADVLRAAGLPETLWHRLNPGQQVIMDAFH
jgi:uncharacterized protein (DUF302 family)